ncbi:hypothetical protein R008_D13961 [Saccharomyces cerevisiae R008]|nr:hypothetical protein R008_D13961 [Saccharomyces cerevisiae R008]
MLSSPKLTSFPPYLLLFITVEGYLCRSCEKILDEKKKKMMTMTLLKKCV